VLLSRCLQSCNELDTDLLTALGKPRSVRQAKGSVMSHSFSTLFRFASLLPFHCAPDPCSPFLCLSLTLAVLLFTLFGEGTQAACCRYGN
jgi:hypothetical protein